MGGGWRNGQGPDLARSLKAVKSFSFILSAHWRVFRNGMI